MLLFCLSQHNTFDPIQHRRIQEYVEIGRKEGADVFQAECPEGEGFFPATFVTNVQVSFFWFVSLTADISCESCSQFDSLPPPYTYILSHTTTFVTNVQSTSPLVQEEIFGPVLVAQTFRTPEEAVALANNSCFGLSVSFYLPLHFK